MQLLHGMVVLVHLLLAEQQQCYRLLRLWKMMICAFAKVCVCIYI
jgi:ribosomal silencing factor RsfS